MWIYYRLYFNTVPEAYQTSTEFASRIIPLSPFNEKLDSHHAEHHLSQLRDLFVFPGDMKSEFLLKQNQIEANGTQFVNHNISIYLISSFRASRLVFVSRIFTCIFNGNPVLFKFLVNRFVFSISCQTKPYAVSIVSLKWMDWQKISWRQWKEERSLLIIQMQWE